MHIPDGPIAETLMGKAILTGGGILTAAGTYIGLKKMAEEQIPRVAVLTSAFFVASLIRLPIGTSSVHPLLGGLLGVMLGWSAFPAILVGLLLQAAFFQHGGISTLGLNTFNFASGAIITYYTFKTLMKPGRKGLAVTILAFFSGAFPVLLAGALFSTEMALTGKEFMSVAWIILIAHIPVMIGEGVLTSFVVHFMLKVKPEALALQPAPLMGIRKIKE